MREGEEEQASQDHNLEDYDILLEEVLSLLDERMRKIIKERYGLTDGVKLTLEEIGSEYAVTRERIRQIQVKALRKLSHPRAGFRRLLQSRITGWLTSRGGVVDGTEADRYFLGRHDGSSTLDLFFDMAIISEARRKDIVIYSPVIKGKELDRLILKTEIILSDSEDALSIDEIKKKLRLKIENFEFYPSGKIQTATFLEKLFTLLPTISEIDGGKKLYTLHSNRKYFPQYWSDFIYKEIKERNEPMHFTEVAKGVNDLKLLDKQLDVRRAHGILITDGRFAHTGVRGTYGLTEWGLRKEMLPDLIEECMNKVGFPLHISQVLFYVGKYKQTKLENIRSCLESNGKFYQLPNGLYWLIEKRPRT